jgi:hypothetical protein
MRQRDEYFAACFAQQQTMLQVSWVISLQLIKHLGIILVLILCITTCIANGGATRIWHDTVRYSAPPPPPFGSPPGAQVYISHVGFHILFIDITIFPLTICFMSFSFCILRPVTMEDQVHIGTSSLREIAVVTPTNQATATRELYAWWLVRDVWIDFLMKLMTLWWICWLCDEYYDFVMNWAIWISVNLCDMWIELV